MDRESFHRVKVMGTITIGRDGVEFVHTNVIVPRHLRDLAKKRGVSMSKELRTALETRMDEGNTGSNALLEQSENNEDGE